jgi:hypothetical protein
MFLTNGSRTNAAQLLHVSTGAENESEMHTESSDIGSGFTRNPENSKVTLLIILEKSRFMDGTNTQTALDGRDQRRTLIQGTTKSVETTLDFGLVGISMETCDGNVLLTCSLLALDETRSTLDANDQTSSNLGIQRSTVSSLFDLQDSFYPGDDLVGGRICGFVEIDNTVPVRGQREIRMRMSWER